MVILFLLIFGCFIGVGEAAYGIYVYNESTTIFQELEGVIVFSFGVLTTVVSLGFIEVATIGDKVKKHIVEQSAVPLLQPSNTQFEPLGSFK